MRCFVLARWSVSSLTVCLAALALAAPPSRDLTVTPKPVPGSVSITGEYWALIIGIDKYQHAPKLESAVKDATAVRDVLQERYRFARDRVIELLDGRATRVNIEHALYMLSRQVGPEDSVLIYYAGHGQYEEDGKLAWWIPVDAEPKQPGTFIMDVAILNYVRGMKAKHVYLVVDSCFSGTLFGTRVMPPIDDQWFARLYAKSSRWGLTSGATEPVADYGKGGHSVFAYHFLTLLKENQEPYLVPSRIYDRLAPLVANNANQTPRSEPLKNAGDEGGQFVFRLAIDTAMADEKESIEEARARPDEAPQQMGREIAGQDGAPMMLVPAGEFLMGSDEGKADEKPVHRVFLDAFYLDKYEVTNKLFQKFVHATGYVTTAEKVGGAWGCTPSNQCKEITGANWRKPEGGETVFVSNRDEHPVVSVSWVDAEAYCRWANKRLPTEAEFEYANRGGTQTTYWWGDGIPGSRRVANIADQAAKQQFSSWPIMPRYDDGYARTAPVGSFDPNPFGLYDTTGNVWEWTADWYGKDYYDRSASRNPTGPPNGEYRVLRGGSWGIIPPLVRSAERGSAAPAAQIANGGFRCAKTP